MERKAVIFSVQRFTIHDGPGLRTELFFKGCPLRCKWCGNPESFRLNPELGVYKSKCISQNKCGECMKHCPNEALIFYRGKLVSFDKDKCTNCHRCYQACPSEAIKCWGDLMTVDECMEIIRKDIGYYKRSGGGVTVSGGEAALHADFIADLFKKCKEEDIHTCFESSFHTKWSEIEKVLPFTDLFITDIKHMNPEIHTEYTGVSNHLILENIKKSTTYNKDLILRIPVIPHVNADMKNIEQTADFILNELEGKVRTLQLLSYMRLGLEKYQALGVDYPMGKFKLSRKSLQKQIGIIADYFNKKNIHCLIGTKEKQ